MTVMIVVIVFNILLNVVKRKIVIQDELSDETLSALDIEAIEKSIIVIPDEESSKVLAQSDVNVDMTLIEQTIDNICKKAEVFKFRIVLSKVC